MFADNEIDLHALPHITEEDLKEIGVALGGGASCSLRLPSLAIRTGQRQGTRCPMNDPEAGFQAALDYLSGDADAAHKKAAE